MNAFEPATLAWLCIGLFAVALLYSSVGHAGASGYIAVMSLMGLSLSTIKPTALALNILVASLASWQFVRAGHFSWRLFWPFAALAVPASYLGGYVDLPTSTLKALLGVVLLISAWRLWHPGAAAAAQREPTLAVALTCGAVIGLLSGLTGTGGGIFLTPLLILMGWAQGKGAAAVSAVFILLNSIAGLAGNWASTQALPAELPGLMLAVGLGGAIGAHLGSQRVPAAAIKKLLAAVLLVAGGKLLLT
jgi:uncharacterized protein